MRNESIKVAIIGSTSPKGKSLKEMLSKSSLNIAGVKLLDDVELAGTLSEYDGGVEMISELTGKFLTDVDLVFFCGSSEHSSDFFSRAVERSGPESELICIDLSGGADNNKQTHWMSSTLPRSSVHVSPITIADPLALGISAILEVCLQLGEPEISVFNAIIPVSEMGAAGNKALHQQTVDLMNFGKMTKGLFDRQLVFNLHPGFGEPATDGSSSYEKLVEDQVRFLLGGIDIPIMISSVRAPVFYSILLSVFVKFKKGVPAKDIIDGFARSSLFRLDKRKEPGQYPPGPLEATDQRQFLIGRVIRHQNLPSAISLSVSYDNLLRGGVLDAVELAEKLVSESEIVG